MAMNEQLTERVRAVLVDIPHVEKKMFGRIAFMVNGKLCITAGDDHLMVRIDPSMHDSALAKEGVSTVVMKGKEYKGYVYVTEDTVKSKADITYWVNLAVEFNKKLKV